MLKLFNEFEFEFDFNFCQAWVKVVEADVERMKSQPNQKPFSDAYLNGMPMKRRKVYCKIKSKKNYRNF